MASAATGPFVVCLRAQSIPALLLSSSTIAARTNPSALLPNALAREPLLIRPPRLSELAQEPGAVLFVVVPLAIECAVSSARIHSQASCWIPPPSLLLCMPDAVRRFQFGRDRFLRACSRVCSTTDGAYRRRGMPLAQGSALDLMRHSSHTSSLSKSHLVRSPSALRCRCHPLLLRVMAGMIHSAGI